MTASDRCSASRRFAALWRMVTADPTKCERSGDRATMSSPMSEIPPAEPVAARAQSRRRDRVGHDDAALGSGEAQIVPERHERHVRAVGDKTRATTGRTRLSIRWMTLSWRCICIGQPLPTCVHIDRPGVCGRAQLRQAWDRNARRRRRCRRSASARVTARSASRSGASVTTRVSPAAASSSRSMSSSDRRADRIARVSAAEPVGLIEKRPLDMNAGNQPFGQRIGGAQGRQRREPAAHERQVVGDDRCQARGDAIGLEGRAGAVQVVGRQSVGVEVDAAVPVHLQVDEGVGVGGTWTCRQCDIIGVRRV